MTKFTALDMFLFLGLLFPSNSLAQSRYSLNFNVQPQFSYVGEYKIPLNPGNPGTPYISLDNTMKIGLETGASVAYHFKRSIALSFGMAYSHMGHKYEVYKSRSNNNDYSWERNLSLNYIKIPLLIHFVPAPQNQVSFCAFGGFYYGVLVGYNDLNKAVLFNDNNVVAVNSEATGDTYAVTAIINGSDAINNYAFLSQPYKKSDLGISLGAGIQMKLSDKLSMPIAINYQRGFVNIKNSAAEMKERNGSSEQFWNNNGANPNFTIKYENAVFGLRLGLNVWL